MNKHERLVFFVDIFARNYVRGGPGRDEIVEAAINRTPEEIELIDDSGNNLMKEAMAFMKYYRHPVDVPAPEWVIEGKKKHREAQEAKARLL